MTSPNDDGRSENSAGERRMRLLEAEQALAGSDARGGDLAARNLSAARQPACVSDRDAFANALETYRPRLVAFFCGRYRRSQEDAEDLASAAILAAWKHADKYDPTRPFEAWVWKIATNHAIGGFRYAQRHPEVHSSDVDSFESLLSAIGGQDDFCSVMQTLSALSELEQDLVCLRHFAGLTPPEIASVLGLNEKTAYRKCSAAEEHFRQSYRGESKDSGLVIGKGTKMRSSHRLTLFAWRFGYARDKAR